MDLNLFIMADLDSSFLKVDLNINRFGFENFQSLNPYTLKLDEAESPPNFQIQICWYGFPDGLDSDWVLSLFRMADLDLKIETDLNLNLT